MNTRLQARSVQPTDLVTSPRAHPPRRSLRSRQGNAGVIVTPVVGSPAVIVACGNELTNKNGVALCKSKRCQTCPKLIQSKYFTSNVTNRKYEMINHTNEIITCKSQNLVYLLTCEGCNIQYVGETTIALHERMNIHRTSKSGCEHFIEHFSDVCSGTSFSIQVIEKLSGDGYDELREVCCEMRDKRLEREDFWMKRLRAIYPYGLCDKAKGKSKIVDNTCIGRLFPPLPRNGERPVSSRNNRNNHLSNITKDEFFHQFDNVIQNNIQESMNHIRKILDTVKKKVLKEIAFSIIDKSWNENGQYKQWYSYVVDIIDTKLYKGIEKKDKRKAPKNLCMLTFVNKGLEHLNLSKILRSPDVVRHLPESLQDEDERPMVSYQLRAPIRNKILNYKETVDSIDFNKDIEEYPCDCAQSTFCNPDHGHIITGNLNIVENSKLRSLLTKGPNYREPVNINYRKCLTEVDNGIAVCAQKMIVDKKLLPDSLDDWKKEILEKVKEQIDALKRKRLTSHRKRLLQDSVIKEYLEILHNKYVIVPVDKAANNFAFICKRYYVARLLTEVGIPNGSSQTYERLDTDYHKIINDNIELCKKYGLQVGEREQCLPIMYWIPKMHKNPVDARFIVASAKCSTKPLSKVVSGVFKLIFMQIRNFHDKSTFYSKYNKFWVIENSSPVINKLSSINSKKRAKEISTFDFKTLYTKIDHSNLIERLNNIIDFAFKGGSRKFIAFNDYGNAFWAKKRFGKRYFTKTSLKSVVKHLIVNCHFQIGNLLLCQIIGIPMGIDPAPFWANLYLYSYECEFMNDLIKKDKSKALSYHGSFRFIDDKCCINGSREFATSFPNIYPPSLELKLEHQGNHATFLDLDITIVDGIFVYKLFDKRDDFPFFIVRMPYLSSDIPSYIFYGSILSEFLRIARCTLLFEDFISRTGALYRRMVNQGGNKVRIQQQIRKVVQRHPIPFSKYRKATQEIINSIIA